MTPASEGGASPASAHAHVRVRAGGLDIDGQAAFPFGGELQYFRVRDPGFDGARTHALWAARLDQLRAAGLDTISTYVPWDYHAPGPDAYDWTGARDLRRFLDLAAARGFRLIVKPGPFILAEWPRGFGSYGAVPLWWRRAHKDALARDRRGRIFCWHPVAPALARFRTSLPSYASSAFREAARGWLAAARAQLDGLLGPGRPIFAIQLDNETNLFWSDLFRIDFHPEALARYRALLEERYGSPAALSQAYGRRIRSFEQVLPPARAGHGGALQERDWVDHLQALIADYHGFLRGVWEDLGVREPDVLFITNDTLQTFPVRDLVLPHGPTKTRHGLYCVDTYPRGLPLPGDNLFDTPYEPEISAKLFARWNALAPTCRGDAAAAADPPVLGIEVQGGHFPLPVPLVGGTVSPHKVQPEATRHTLLRLLVHGMRGIVVYTAVGGLNLDGSTYDFQAALGMDGEERPRYRELERFARLLRNHGDGLLRARPHGSKLAIVADGGEGGPGYGERGPQRILGHTLRGLFGWCAAAGLTPALTDLSLASAAELGRYQALLFPCSGAIRADKAELLRAYVEAGGTLVQLLDPGPLRDSLFPGEPLRPAIGWLRWAASAVGAESLFEREVRVRFQAELSSGSFTLSAGEVPLYRLPRGAATVLASQAHAGDAVLGYQRDHGLGRAIFLALSPGDAFAGRGFYGLGATDLTARGLFLRRLLRPAGVGRLFGLGVHEEAHALRDPGDGTLYVAVLSSHAAAGTVQVRLRGLEQLGLERGATYLVEDLFGVEGPAAAEIGRYDGQALRERGIYLGLPRYGATLLRVRRA